MRKTKGYFLLLAVIFILVMGIMGAVMTSLVAGRATITGYQFNGLKAFYNAESALEITMHYLNRKYIVGTPKRISCASVTGTAQLTNASLNGGTFTATTINSSPIYSVDTLSGALTSSATSLTLASSSGFAPMGRLFVDREAIDYTSISGNTFNGLTRGTGGTLASSHASGAGVGQYQCSIDVIAGIPSVTTPTFRRNLRMDLQLQNGYAVGANSGSNETIINWNRNTELSWINTSYAGTSANRGIMRAVSMVSSVDGWATGARITAGFPFLRWNGSAWAFSTLAGACTGQNLNGISMVSSAQGFAVGARYRPACASSGNYRYTILAWNGTSWSLLTPSTSPSIPADSTTLQNLNGVHVIDTNGDARADNGFAVGNSGTILRYNGTNWVTYSSPTSSNLNAVYTVSASEAWAVGAGGLILRWNGSAWSSFTTPASVALNAISMIDTDGDGLANFGVIAGASGNLLTYNGTSWTRLTSGSTAFNGADVFNANDAWVVGASGAIRHWEGSAWATYTSPVSVNLWAISLVRPGTPPISTWRQMFK